MERNTLFRTGLALLVAGLLALLGGCGGDDNGLSPEQMAQLSTAQTEAETAHEEVENLNDRIAALQAQIAELQMDDGDDETASEIEELENRLAELRGRVDQEGFPTTPTPDPTSGPQVDIGVEHVSGVTEAAGMDFITNSPIKSRISPAHYLSLDYDTERRHYNVALITGTAAVGFAGRQYLDGAETYGGWMEYNHFGVFPGTDDDGRAFTDVWSIGERSGSNPTGSELSWSGAFVGQEMAHIGDPTATNPTEPPTIGDRMRGSAMLTVMLGDPLNADASMTIDRAQLTVGDFVNIDDSSAGTPYPNALRTGFLATTGEHIIPINDGMFMQASDTGISSVAEDGTNALIATGFFTIEGSFYGDAQQEVGGIFTFGDDATDTADAYYLEGAFGADRLGN